MADMDLAEAIKTTGECYFELIFDPDEPVAEAWKCLIARHGLDAVTACGWADNPVDAITLAQNELLALHS